MCPDEFRSGWSLLLYVLFITDQYQKNIVGKCCHCRINALPMIVPGLYRAYPISYTQKISKFHKISKIKKKKNPNFKFFLNFKDLKI